MTLPLQTRIPIHLQAKPGDFVVEEILRLKPASTGDFALYKAQKRLMTTLDLQQHLATELNFPPSAFSFPALKDKGALATQYFTLRGKAPDEIRGEGFAALFVGRLARPLSPSDLAGNRFVITLHDLPQPTAEALAQQLQRLAITGLPNYFDEQRFGSHRPGAAFFGKAVLQGNAEEALRIYMLEPAPGDPAEVHAFKAKAADFWPDWTKLFHLAPRSNYRSLLSFLKDHPTDYRKALNLITPRLLPLLLAAYQSHLWNRILARHLQTQLPANSTLPFRINDEPLALYSATPPDTLRSLALPLPQHRAVYLEPALQSAVEHVLTEEGLTLDRLKARILEHAYLPKGTRPALLFPSAVEARILPPGVQAAGALRLSFFLPPGSYATLVIKSAAALLSAQGT